ncbi:MAG: hypothetical protein NVS9B1_06930 [Candidatus Dormibacteraceae bacterium]
MSKAMTMSEAIASHVRDGMSIAAGCCLEPLIPFAAGHEIIRQGRRDLELIGPISDSLFDQLIGAGCVRRVTAAWAGNVSEGLGHNYRRAAEGGAILVISSELPELLNVSTRIIVLRAGRIIGELTREQATPELLLRMMAGVA